MGVYCLNNRLIYGSLKIKIFYFDNTKLDQIALFVVFEKTYRLTKIERLMKHETFKKLISAPLEFIKMIVFGFYISMFTDLHAKRLNWLTWNLKHILPRSQVIGGIHKKWTFTPRRNFSIFFSILIPSSNKKTLIELFLKI